MRHIGFFILSLFAGCLSETKGNPLVYAPEQGSSRGKSIVLIASDHEYRSEETVPALARILARHHGIHCSVLFGLNENGEIEAGASNIPGTEALAEADGLVLFTRFQNLPDEQMAPLAAYLDRAGPVVGLRTSTHGFKIPAGMAYRKYSFDYKGEEYRGGFGEQVLGQSWVGHYGENHRQSTRIDIVPERAGHPILRGVKDVHVQAGGYNAEPQSDWTVLTRAQPLMSMEADGSPDPGKPPMASEWTREYTAPDGSKGRVFTSLYGASEDILNPGYRRLLINGIYWSLGLENEIKADSVIDFVGPYEPSTFRGGGFVKGIKPSAYAGFASPVPAVNEGAGALGARYLRIELPGKRRTLTLAEVEVISGDKNIAPAGKASQSGVSHEGPASRAIDGNASPRWEDGGQSHGRGNVADPWWELDLGKEVGVDAVRVWNRGGGFGGRLDGFSLSLLDADRKKVFEKKGITAPESSLQISVVGGEQPVYFTVDGKPGKKKDWSKERESQPGMAVRPPVEVPGGYRDPAAFAFQRGDVIALIGNALGERFQHHGALEAPIQAALPSQELSFRNLCVSGDRVGKFPRSSECPSVNAYLQHVGADVILCFFGYNESFEDKPKDYGKRLLNQVHDLRSYQPNGESFPRIVLFSPIAHEDLEDANLPSGRANNKRLARYAEATRGAAEEAGVAFVDLFEVSRKLYREEPGALTINGIHLNERGCTLLGRHIAAQLTGRENFDEETLSGLRAAVTDKNWHWFNRYRATDGNDIWGGRSKISYAEGQNNAVVLWRELVMFDAMTASRDHAIWALARGNEYAPDDDEVPPPFSVVSNVGGKSPSSKAQKEGSTTYLTGEEAIAKMRIPKGFEVKLFADEAMFPELANPVQMQVDGRGRLWVAAWHTYPKWEPLKKMRDALLIFEDTDGDGRADSCKEFARVHNPVGFEFWNGGVLVTSAPDLLFLKDTDGDDVADVREVILGGFGSADTHHAANNLVMGPDGGIYWQSGIFLQNAHEHPWGAPLVTGASGMYRFDPRRSTIAFQAALNHNPHGISFDAWGYHYATDGTSGRAYQVRPEGKGFKMHELLKRQYRPVPANAVISSENFPEELQGDFLIANTIGFRGIMSYDLHRDGYDNPKRGIGEVWGTPGVELVRSEDGNFRPTDMVFGAEGALYFSDWCNVIIGHSAHHIRDPNRDKQHGRIYRMIHEGRPLQEPVAIAEEPLDKLMHNLEHPVDGVRHRTRIELSGRATGEVIAACKEWLGRWDPQNPDHARYILEALWVHQQHNVRDRELLDVVLALPVEHARIAGAAVKHHWDVADPALGLQEIEEEEEVHFEPGGLVSDTPELTTLRINTILEQLRYDVKELEVKAGKRVKLIFNNPDAVPHNLVIVKPGTADAVANAAIALGAEGFAREFIPESEDILHYTKLLNGGETEEIVFDAPSEPGDYQFVCSFPGHAMLMRGILRVKQ